MAILGKDRLQRNVELFCQYVQDAGYTPMIYASTSFMKNYIDPVTCNKWIACYRATPEYNTSPIKYWQYTSKGHVTGIQGNVDLDYAISNVTTKTYSTK